jgi:hypothetical protein
LPPKLLAAAGRPAPALHYKRVANDPDSETQPVDLTLWIPLTLGLGLGALALMYLFVEACDRV